MINFLLGESKSYTLEQRLFLAALIIGMFLGFIGTLVNYFLVNELVSYLIPLVGSLILAVFYYFSRFKGYFKQLANPIVFFAFIALGILWCFNAGIDSPNDLIFLVAFALALVLVESNNKIYVLILFTIIKSILYFIQLYYPESIVPYTSEEARWLDIFVTSISSSVVIYLLIKILHHSYTLERKKVEESKAELARINKKLEESNSTKDLLFSIISHDLRSPFNSIIGFSTLIANGAETMDRAKTQFLAENINSTASGTYFLLDNLLKWSGLQKGTIEPIKVETNLHSLSNQVLNLYQTAANGKKISLINQISNEMMVKCDLEITKTVLRNLLANAIKYTESGGQINLMGNISENQVVVGIQDSGVGIDEEKLPELFSISNNHSTRGTANEKGTGLGLHLCKALIEIQGGKIWLESKPGFGSIFYFTLERAHQ